MLGRSFGLSGITSYAFPFVVRNFDWGRAQASTDRALALDAPLLAVLCTRADEGSDWLRAGEALESVLLTARARGVFAAFANQPVQVAPLRERLRACVGDVPQLVLRLGYASDILPSRRRAIEEVIAR
jgi:hypothetical protein